MKLNYQLILSAFIGGIVLSLIELTNMFKQKESPDIFFFGGLLIAGIIGIVGYFMTGANDVRTAFVSGVSAPQLLGGIVKIGSAGAQAVSLLFAPMNAYAQTPTVDTVNVLVLSQFNNVKIKTNDTVFVVNDSNKIKMKYQDSITIFVDNIPKKVELQKTSNTITIKKSNSNFSKFFRGMIAQKSIESDNSITIK